VISGAIDWASVSKWVNEETYESNTSRCRPEYGDVLYTAVGSFGVAVPVETEKRFMFQRHIAHIKPDRSRVNTRFLVHVLNSPAIRAVAERVAKGVAQRTVTLSDLRNFEISLPPLSEQRRIADIIDKADAIRHKRKEAIGLTVGLLRSAFLEMFGDPVTNPRGWPVRLLSQVADVRDGTHETPAYVSHGVPFVTSTHLKGDHIDFSGTKMISREDHARFSVRSCVDDGNILFGMIGTIGSATLVHKDREFSIKNVALIKPRLPGSGPYLWSLLSNERFLGRMLLNAKGGNQKFVALGPLRALPVPEPDAHALTRFAEFLRVQRRVRETATSLAQDCEQLFHTVIQESFGRHKKINR
jgi:type I restriction enzyme S subunit